MTAVLCCIAFLHCRLCREAANNFTDWPVHNCFGPVIVTREVGMEKRRQTKDDTLQVKVDERGESGW